MLKIIERKIKESQTMRSRLMVGTVPVPTRLDTGKSVRFNGSVRAHEIYPKSASITRIDKICEKYPIINYFILAHENGHIFYNHTKHPLFWGWIVLVAGVITSIEVQSGLALLPFAVLAFPAQMYQSRLWEYRADLIAIKVLLEFIKSDEVILGDIFKSPEELRPILDFFKTTPDEKKVYKFSFLAKLVKIYENLISTHPTNEKRKAMILRKIQSEYPDFQG